MCFGVVWIDKLPKLSFLNIGSILAFLQNCLWLVALLKFGRSIRRRKKRMLSKAIQEFCLCNRVKKSTFLGAKVVEILALSSYRSNLSQPVF